MWAWGWDGDRSSSYVTTLGGAGCCRPEIQRGWRCSACRRHRGTAGIHADDVAVGVTLHDGEPPVQSQICTSAPASGAGASRQELLAVDGQLLSAVAVQLWLPRMASAQAGLGPLGLAGPGTSTKRRTLPRMTPRWRGSRRDRRAGSRVPVANGGGRGAESGRQAAATGHEPRCSARARFLDQPWRGRDLPAADVVLVRSAVGRSSARSCRSRSVCDQKLWLPIQPARSTANGQSFDGRIAGTACHPARIVPDVAVHVAGRLLGRVGAVGVFFFSFAF